MIIEHKGLKFNFNNLPEELKSVPHWCLWSYEMRNGRETKVPKQTTGANAASDNPLTWTSFEAVQQKLIGSKFDGIGFMFSEENEYIGIDIDHCRNSDGSLTKKATDLLTRFNSYSEWSPSGEGVHVILKANGVYAGKKQNDVECYSQKRFFTMTGNRLTGYESVRYVDNFSEWYQEYWQTRSKGTSPNVLKHVSFDESQACFFGSKKDSKWSNLYVDGDWKSAGFISQSEADYGLAHCLVRHSQGDTHIADLLFRESALYRDKWDEVHYGNGSTYGEQILQDALNNNIDLNSIHEPGSLIDKLIKLVLSDTSLVIFSSDNEGYIRFPVNGVFQNWRIRSGAVSNWITKLCYDTYKKAPSAENIKSVQGLLHAKAMYEGAEYPLSNRVAEKNGNLYYDLCNDRWQYVCISPSDWKIEESREILFKRFSSSVPSVSPVFDGDFQRLFHLYNLSNSNDELLLKVLLVYYFLPNVTYPIAYFFGDQGSGKSSICRVLRQIIDPSLTDISEFPKNVDDFVLQLNQSHLSVFDNVSHITAEQSDRLCRAATGGSFLKRILYSNDDTIIQTYKRPVVLNGINLGATKSDLLDRAILFKLSRIDESRRMTEDKLKSYLEKALPGIVGYCFTILCKALSLKNENLTTPINLGRMADFESYGWYIAQALGYSGEEFVAAMRENKSNQVFEALNSDSLAQAVIALMSDNPYWSGQPTLLLQKLRQYFSERDNSVKNPPSMMRKLNELKPNMKEIGIIIESGKENESTRFVRITRAQTTKPDATDNTDSNLQSTVESTLF